MKKINATILAVLLAVLTVVDSVFGFSNMTVKAANSLQVSVDKVNAKQGDKNVQVGVHIKNADKVNIGAVVLEVTWDKAALKATNVTEGAIKVSNEPAINTENLQEGVMYYADASDTGITTEGTLFTITFDVPEDAVIGENPIQVKVLSAASATPEGDNMAPAIKDITEVNGGINVTEQSVVQNSLKVSVDKVDAKQGDKNVQVAVRVENPDKVNIGAVVLEVTWNKAALKATNVVEGEMKWTEEPVINTEKLQEGIIYYVNASATGVTTEGTLFTMTFDVIDGAMIGENPIQVKVLSAASATPEGNNCAPAIKDITEVQGSINVEEIICTHANVKDSDYKVVKEPTVTEEGIEEATCPDCGKKLTRPIEKLVCTHANIKDSDYKVVKEPTFTEEGVSEATCPDCGKKLTRPIEKLVCTHANIKDSDYKVVKEPTFTEEGVSEATCPDCGEKFTRPIEKLVCTHVNVKDSDYKVVKEPTVTEEGIEEATCPDCGKKLTRPIEKIKYGDVNADGSINVQDAVLLKKHLADVKGLKINLAASDVQFDNHVNIQDAVILLKYLAGVKVTMGK